MSGVYSLSVIKVSRLFCFYLNMGERLKGRFSRRLGYNTPYSNIAYFVV